MIRSAVLTALLATSAYADTRELLICSTSPIFTPDFVSQSYSSVFPSDLRPVVFNTASVEDLNDGDEDLIFVFLGHNQLSHSLACFADRTDEFSALERAALEALSRFDEPMVIYGLDTPLGPPEFGQIRYNDGEDDIVFVLWRWEPGEAAEMFSVSLQTVGGFQRVIEDFLREAQY